MDRELPPEIAALNGIRVQTVHASKGMEFEAVHLGFATATDFGEQKPSWAPPSIQDIVPPAVLNSSAEEFDHETAVERNNLLYVALSRAKRHLYVYQNNEYQSNPVRQLKYPQPYDAVHMAARASVPVPVPAPSQNEAAHTFADPVPFDRFRTFAICALQYWYAYTAQLGREETMEPAMRARAAIMDGLKHVANGSSALDEGALQRAWLDNRLPTAADDPRLWGDAQAAYGRGLRLISTTRQAGGQFMEPVAILADLPVKLPWGFVTKPAHTTHFQPIRFSRTSVMDVVKHLRPLLVGMPLAGSKTLTLNYVLSDKTDDVKPSGALESTDAFKASVRLRNGDLRPTRGTHCSRCAFQSICPGTPGH